MLQLLWRLELSKAIIGKTSLNMHLAINDKGVDNARIWINLFNRKKL